MIFDRLILSDKDIELANKFKIITDNMGKTNK